MNFYHSLFRFYVQFDWRDVWHGTRLAIGRWPKVSPLDEAWDAEEGAFILTKRAPTIPDDPEAHGIVHVGAQSFEATVEPLNLPCKISGDPS